VYTLLGALSSHHQREPLLLFSLRLTLVGYLESRQQYAYANTRILLHLPQAIAV
jgi:hypothetical protein